MRVSVYVFSLCVIARHGGDPLFLAPPLRQSRPSPPRHGHPPPSYEKTKIVSRMISSGLSFSDGDQILVSAQKPLGMVLEQDPETVVIRVVEVDPNGSVGKGGVRVGDVLVAVQNASAEDVDLEDVLAYIGNGPRVMNLRLRRAK